MNSMKFFCVLAVCIMICSCDSMSQQKAKLKTRQDSVSYSIGADIGKNMKTQELNLDLNVMLAGMKDAMGGKVQLTEEQSKAVMMSFQQEMMTKMQAKKAKEGEANVAQGKKFLEENGKKAGVITTASGLQYKMITEGSGKTPTDSSTVKVHYKGTLIDGTKFDSSYDRGQPIEFLVKGVIPGWTEALKLMKAGSKAQLYIPSDLAYREQGAPPSIPPNATLIFDVELLEVVK
jgi:FKBP-type peptidyl-prolyl cis-trans isomerase FklB